MAARSRSRSEGSARRAAEQGKGRSRDAGGSNGFPEGHRADGEAAAQQPVLRGELDDLLADMQKAIVSEIQQASAATQAAVGAHTAETIKKYDSTVQRRFSAMEADVVDHEQRITKQEEGQRELAEEIRKIRAELAMATEAPHVVRGGARGGFERDVDPTILRTSARDLLARTAVEDALRTVMQEAGLGEDQWKVKGGNGLSTKHVVAFSGCPRVAARRAEKVLDLLRPGESGEWRKIVAQTPAKADVQLFVSEDKAPKTIKTEIWGKKLAQVVREAADGRDVHLLRKEGAITIAWQRVVRVNIEDGKPPALQWDNDAVQRLALDKAKIAEAFAALVAAVGPAPASSAQWSS